MNAANQGGESSRIIIAFLRSSAALCVHLRPKILASISQVFVSSDGTIDGSGSVAAAPPVAERETFAPMV
jgi:hypothetical protein